MEKQLAQNQPKASTEKAKVGFGPTYTFRLRRHEEGNFKGLWELSILNKMGHVSKIVEDANALNFCLDNLMGVLEDDGF